MDFNTLCMYGRLCQFSFIQVIVAPIDQTLDMYVCMYVLWMDETLIFWICTLGLLLLSAVQK